MQSAPCDPDHKQLVLLITHKVLAHSFVLLTETLPQISGSLASICTPADLVNTVTQVFKVPAMPKPTATAAPALEPAAATAPTTTTPTAAPTYAPTSNPLVP